MMLVFEDKRKHKTARTVDCQRRPTANTVCIHLVGTNIMLEVKQAHTLYYLSLSSDTEARVDYYVWVTPIRVPRNLLNMNSRGSSKLCSY